MSSDIFDRLVQELQRELTLEEWLSEQCGFGRDRTINTWHVEDKNITEVDQMIVEAVLTAVFDFGQPGLPWFKLFEQRLDCTHENNRVLSRLMHLLEAGLLLEEETLIIPSDPQRCMDFAGLWFPGFDPPEGVETLSLSPEGRETLEDPEKTGSLIVDFLSTMEAREKNPFLLSPLED